MSWLEEAATESEKALLLFAKEQAEEVEPFLSSSNVDRCYLIECNE